MAFHKAERRKAKLRLGITGPAGSGKTYGALMVGLGLGGKIAMIDTENGSGDLYSALGDYDVCTLEAPYTVQKYLAAIDEAEKAEYDVLIIDSLSHAWAGEGGLLDLQGKIADSSRSSNSYTAWRQVTPLHNKLVEAMLSSRCHIIATMRSKTEYVQEKSENGKTIIRKVGLAPVQRDGMDYEFGVVFDLGLNHTATVSKDRTSLFDGQVFTLTKETGEALKKWLESGEEPAPARNVSEKPTGSNRSERPNSSSRWAAELWKRYLDACGGDAEAAKIEMQRIASTPSKSWTEDDFIRLEKHLEAISQEPEPLDAKVMPDPDEAVENVEPEVGDE